MILIYFTLAVISSGNALHISSTVSPTNDSDSVDYTFDYPTIDVEGSIDENNFTTTNLPIANEDQSPIEDSKILDQLKVVLDQKFDGLNIEVDHKIQAASTAIRDYVNRIVNGIKIVPESEINRKIQTASTSTRGYVDHLFDSVKAIPENENDLIFSKEFRRLGKCRKKQQGY